MRMRVHRSTSCRARLSTSAADAAVAGIPTRVAPAKAVLRTATAVLLAGTCLSAIAVLAPHAAHAVDGTWTGPGSEWTTGINWSSNPTVPDGTATFTNNLAPTAVTISADASINTIQFNAGAPAYSFTIQGFALFKINGAGIVNSSAFAPSFTGGLGFFGSSTAGNATITNTGDLEFLNSSTAGNATITNNNGGLVFSDTSTAGNATITNNVLVGLLFKDTSTAGSATITNTGGLIFLNSSTAGNATIITNNGGNTSINQSASGGQARFITNAGGTVDISSLTSAGTTAGSIEGAGNYFLGSKSFTVGSNNLSTTVSGIIADGGKGGGVGGSLTKVGTGTMTLTGANTYSGGTTLAQGTLSLQNNRALGTGSVVFAGAGVLDYANSVVIANPITLAGDGAQFSVTTASATQAGAISELGGSRGFTKIGAGTLVLTGTHTFTGGIVINDGEVVDNTDSAEGHVHVNSGGTISGNGVLTSLTLNGGTLSPGNSIGLLTVQGSLVMNAAASYLVEVSPTNADRVNVGGSANIGGTVKAVFAPGGYSPRSYTILSAAGGRSGTFDGLTTVNLPSSFVANLSYNTTDVLLNLTAALGLVTPLVQNQQNVAGAINGFFNNGGALPPNFLNLFNLNGSNLSNALSQLSGEAATAAQKVGFQLTDQFLNLMLDPFVDGRSGVGGADHPALGFAPARDTMPPDIAHAYAAVLKAPPKAVPVYEPRWTVWGGAYGGGNKTSGDLANIGSHDLSTTTAGFAGGFDYHLSRDSVVGLAFAGGGTNWSLAQGLGSGKSDAFQAGVYGATKSGPAYLAAAFAFTNHWMSTDRLAFGDHLTANFNAQSYGGRLEGGYRFGTPYGGITPYAAIQAQSFHTPSYSETGLIANGFALAFNGRDATDTRSELGARFDRALALYPNAVLALRGRLAWAHDWVSDPTLTPLFQTLPGASFVVNGALPAKDAALVSAGAEYRLANGITLLGKFDGEFASRSSTYAGTGTVRYSW
jgi:autotransporter-associated beta strand protein